MSFARRRWLCLAAVLALCAAFPAFGQRASGSQLRQWKSFLNSDDPQKRVSAATSLLGADDSDALDALLDALKPEKPEAVRISVITAFGVKGDDRACREIITALADQSEAVRQAAKGALLTINTPRSVAMLRQAAADVKRPLTIRVQAINILGELREIEAIQALIPLLTDREEAIRTAARNALKSITLRDFNTAREWQDWWKDRVNVRRADLLEELIALQGEKIRTLNAVVERLYTRMLEDPRNQTDKAVLTEALTQCDSPAVKKSAIKWLTAQHADAVRTALIAALSEPDASVRQAAADALAAQADAAATPALLKAINDPDSSVRAAAARALGVLKAGEAVEPLIAMLSDSAVEAAVAAANALAELADPRALDALINVVKASSTPAPLYDAAANALAKIKDPRAVSILVTLLESPKENVRWASADALGELRAAAAVKPLATVARKDSNPQIREAALAALSKIGDPAALETLVDALSDPETRVAAQALRSLTQVADSDTALYGKALDRLVAAGRHALAATVLDAAVAKFPSNPQAVRDLRLRLATGLMAAKEWAAARTQLETLVTQSPQEPQYIKSLVACLSAQADYDALLARLLQARKAVPELADYCWQETVRAVEQIAAADPKKAVAVVDDLAKDSPDLGGPATAAKLRDLRAKAASANPHPPATGSAAASTIVPPG